MKPFEIKKKARDKANAMEPIAKTLHFTDKAGVPGSCQVSLPASVFNFVITRRVAENLLDKHKEQLPFDILRPLSVSEDGDWIEVTKEHLTNGKLPANWTILEMWESHPSTDIPDDLFQSPNAK